MSVGETPKPTDRADGKASPEGGQTQAAAPEQAAPEAPTLPLNEDMARILMERAEVIVQRQTYHSQMMVGVSALGSDPVSVRNAVLTIANGLRNNHSDNIEYALVTLGDPQLQQVNDHTLPWKYNAQTSGLMEGLLIDTLMQAYRDDPQKQLEAREKLEAIFLEANERLERQHKAQLAFLAPGPHPNVLTLTPGVK